MPKLTANNVANLYVGTDDKVHIPTEHYRVDAFQAYFLIDLGGGAHGKPGPSPLREVKLNIASEGIPVRIISITFPESLTDGDNVWYDLQGRKYTTLPTQGGIYITGGKKVLIR